MVAVAAVAARLVAGAPHEASVEASAADRLVPTASPLVICRASPLVISPASAADRLVPSAAGAAKGAQGAKGGKADCV